MSEEEKGVLETFKKGYGLTKAETEILLNLIDKQQKEIEKLKERDNKLINSAIDVIFSEDNNDVETLARTLYQQGIIQRDKDNYINPYYHETDLL